MAFSKKHLYPIDDQLLSNYAKAIAYPARLEILRTLQLKGKLTVHELWKDHPISEETFSDHIRILRTAQLIDFEERFPYTFYYINAKNLKQAEQLLLSFLAFFKA